MAEFYKTRLKNGMTVLFEKRKLPITAILIATRAGAAHESASKKGIAHFSEHMLFKGTRKRSAKQLSSTIEKVGGILNGFTSDEITAFWCKLPSKHFSEGAEIISDLILNPKFDAKDIEAERNVILSEISMYHDIPQHYLFEKIKELLYKKPFGMPVAGTKESISKINREDFLNWHRFYCPNNLIVSVVGDSDMKEVLSFVKSFKPSEKVFLPAPKVIRKKGNLVETRKGLDQTHFALAISMPSLSEKARYAGELFNAVLGEGMSSKLFQEIREKRGLAYTIKAFLEQEKSYGHTIIYAGIESKNIKKVKELVLREINSMAKFNLRELEEAKEQKIGNWQVGLESCDETARALAIQEIATAAEEFYSYPEKISQVKLQDIRALAKIKNYSTAVLVPK